MSEGIEALARFQATQANSSLVKVDSSNKEKLKESAEEFEALFVKQMLDTMRQSLHKEDRLFQGGMAEDIFEDMLYTEYSRVFAKTGNFGIADAIQRQYEPFMNGKAYS